MSIPRTSGIYQILCVPTGKVYIGSTVNLRKRKRDHWSSLTAGNHENGHLQRAWNKYGESAFVFTVLELVMFVEYLVEREQFWIDQAMARADTHMFNICKVAGSSLGMKHSEETNAANRARNLGRKMSEEARFNMSKAQRERVRDPGVGKKISEAKRGFKFTKESRQRMSAAQFRRTDHRKQYIVTDPAGNDTLIPDLNAFCREHNMCRESLYAVLMGKRKHHKGWRCRHVPQT